MLQTYDETFDGKFTRSFKMELAKIMHLESGYKILDVACGNGTLLKLLSDKSNIEAYGVDISENMIKEAKIKYPQMRFSVTNSAKLPFEDGIFDVISVCAAFHHFTEPSTFILEAKRVLKQGGYILFTKQWEDFNFKLECGECLREVQERNVAALNDVLKNNLGSNIVVGSHGTALSTIINYYNPDFGYEGFWSIADKMPYILCFKFKNIEFLGMEEVELWGNYYHGLKNIDFDI